MPVNIIQTEKTVEELFVWNKQVFMTEMWSMKLTFTFSSIVYKYMHTYICMYKAYISTYVCH